MNPPMGPHIQSQNAIARKTMKGLSVIRRPITVGVTNCASIAFNPR